MKQFCRSLRAVWHGTIWQWWFLLAGFSHIVAEGVRFFVSTVLMYTLGDGYAGMDLFTPELTLWYLGTPGNDPLRWFNARALQVVTAYALGWLLVGLLPAWRKQRPRHALMMLETACVFVAANLTALALWIFVFKYDSHTITSTNWVLLVFQSFTLPAYCIVGVVVAMAGARATWRTAGRALVVGLALFLIDVARQHWSEEALARIFAGVSRVPLWADLLPQALMIVVVAVAALFMYAAVADGNNLWRAVGKGIAFQVHHVWLSLAMGTILFISSPAMVHAIETVSWWLARPAVLSYPGKFSMKDVYSVVFLVALVMASQYYNDVTHQTSPEQTTSSEPAHVGSMVLMTRGKQIAVTGAFLVVALVAMSIASLPLVRPTNTGLPGIVGKTVRLAGSSPHWEVTYTIVLRTSTETGLSSSRMDLDARWTGDASQKLNTVRYKITDNQWYQESNGLVLRAGHWTTWAQGGSYKSYWDAEPIPEATLTMSWNNQSEAMPLMVVPAEDTGS
jgi:hypothetical protein